MVVAAVSPVPRGRSLAEAWEARQVWARGGFLSVQEDQMLRDQESLSAFGIREDDQLHMCGGGRPQIPRQWSCQVWKGGMLAHKATVLPVWLLSACEVRLQWEETAAPNKVEDRQGTTITQDSGVTLGCL